MRTVLVLALASAAAVLLAVSSGVDDSSGQEVRATVHTVKMKGNNTFEPAEVKVKVGDQVKWVGEGGTHTATADDQTNLKKSFNTGTVKMGQEAIINCNNAGTFLYHCEFHGPMKGKIVVE
ncbi:MAG: cupredoxin domain-containing protein [Planctomycetaceae bacterium]|nr:cupredoxin domain-containing protein [Planctomycetaceae bacterium]